MDEKLFDVTIIGGGPAGLFTAFYAGLRQMSVKVIESLPRLGGQLSALYPEKFIYDVAGFPKVRARELVDHLVRQMNLFDQEICLEESVDSLIKRDDGTFILTTEKGKHFSRAIIMTAGNGAFQPRKLPLEKAAFYEKSNLYCFVENIKAFTDKKVLVFGGGDSAVDWSLMLEPVAKEVNIAHRRDHFRAHEHSVSLLENSTANIWTPYIPVDLEGEKRIETVTLQHVKTKEKILIEVDAVLCNYGFAASLGPIKNWGLEIEKNSIVVDSKMETNIKGVYAVGDINTYEGKVKLIATGFGEAPIAVSHAKAAIDPSSRIQPVHSTTIMARKKVKV